MTLTRRTLLRVSAAGLVGGLLPRPALASGTTAFADSYRTNLIANQTAETNAAVRILSGMGELWQNGVVLAPELLRANVRFCERRTARRTDDQAARAFIVDRQHQSYSILAGLGPLAPRYKAGALAVTSITEAPAGTPPTTISDAVPADAPPGSAIGAGSTTSALGLVATLVNTVRGDYSSGNPSKYAYQYPRPWRMTEDSEVVDTGAVDEFGYPVYDSRVIVAPQLLRQRSTSPFDDGGFPSGHTNALHLAALAYAYAFPERFQELVTCAFDLSDTRITAGMHSPVDVVGGRILATALAAAILSDPANAELKAAARAQAAAYFAGFDGDGDDAYADRAANRDLVRPKLTYVLPREGPDRPLTVPKGAEVLLETRQPYLTAAQRRAVLRSTALPAGYPLIDGPEEWGRLDLFRAADGYGAFETDVDVTLDKPAADSWRNDITGPGGLTLRGTGQLTLTGHNRFRGALRVLGGTLRLTGTTAPGRYQQVSATLATTVRAGLRVAGTAEIGPGSTLELTTDGRCGLFEVLTAGRVTGRFATITVLDPGLRADPVYTRTAVLVRIVRG
ncbi:phosphatase PAP2 family protein [Paractinoplanes durhamensis]|uniref:Phosphoesterase n=1 Tax=Paractinoplanes durhamensis TaxID=113563 RepID=A0ABQ3Z721_9ACTN|nr:phosphatase PAP2 family protein [Actinoplanes durhamensis]GIE05627.1 phosphoesterase [Actinoplanes durhamensis]